MKTLAALFATSCWLLFWVAVPLHFSGCAETTIRTVTTDKAGTVTDVTTTTKATDPAALGLLGTVVNAYAPPRAHVVRQEKAAPTMGDLLRKWQAGRRMALRSPIRADEVAARYRADNFRKALPDTPPGHPGD